MGIDGDVLLCILKSPKYNNVVLVLIEVKNR